MKGSVTVDERRLKPEQAVTSDPCHSERSEESRFAKSDRVGFLRPKKRPSEGHAWLCALLRKIGGARDLPVLRIYPVNHPGEGDHLANMLGAANPSDGALKAEAKPGVRDAAIAA